MQRLLSLMRAAIQKYDMIQRGDRIAVGVSGGKDSIALLAALKEMQRFYPLPFELAAISVDMGFSGENSFDPIKKFCEDLEIDFFVKNTRLGKIIFEERKESNPCSLCAKMRRGILHDFAKQNNFNKLALGHHLDDAAETFMLNLLHGGVIGSFRPVTHMSKKDIYVIRPMIFIKESKIEAVVKNKSLPTIKSGCIMDGKSERQKIKELINSLECEYPALRQKVLNAMQKKGLDGW